MQTPKDILFKDNNKTYQNVLNIKPTIVEDYMKNIEKIKKGGYFYCLLINGVDFVVDFKIKFIIYYILQTF